MTKGQRLATILVSILLVIVVGGGAAFALSVLFGKGNGNKLSDKDVIKAVTATVDTLETLHQNNNTVQTVRTETTVTDIGTQDATTLVTVVPLAYISYVDYLMDAKVLKVGTLQYDKVTEDGDSYDSYLYTLVTQKDGLVYVNVLYKGEEPSGDSFTYTSYEINYDFKKDELVDFNFVQFHDGDVSVDDSNIYYVCYRYNIKEDKVYLFNPEVKGISAEQYQLDMSAGKVDGEYISNYITGMRCFECKISNIADYQGYDIMAVQYAEGVNKVEFDTIPTEQQTVVLNIIANVKDYIIPYKQTVETFDLTKAELCDTISEANDYVNNTYLPSADQ